jgi:transcriptional regulator with XRE-family HTH domain
MVDGLLLYIGELQRRLIETARRRVSAGQWTERGLARRCNLSQSHMHNVLSNIRALSNSSADRLMHALDLTVPELLWRFSNDIETEVRAVPLIHNRIGPGNEAVFSIFRGYLPFPAGLVQGLVQPVAARLAPDLALPKMVAANDLVLLDQNTVLRREIPQNNCWVVADSAGLRIRYARLGAARVYLANEATVADPPGWRSVSLAERDILDIVRARIVWIGREMEMAPAGPAGPPGSVY